MNPDNQPLVDVPPVEPAQARPSRRSTGRPPGRPRKDRAPTDPTVIKPGRYKQPVMGLYGTIGMAVSLAKPQVGMAIVSQAEAAATAWDKAARQNPAIRRVLDAALTTSTWSELVIAHLPIVFALLSEQGWLDSSPLAMFAGAGVPPAPAPPSAPSADRVRAEAA